MKRLVAFAAVLALVGCGKKAAEAPKQKGELTTCAFRVVNNAIEGSVGDAMCAELAKQFKASQVAVRDGKARVTVGGKDLPVDSYCVEGRCGFMTQEDIPFGNIKISFVGKVQPGKFEIDDVMWCWDGVDSTAPGLLVHCDFTAEIDAKKTPGEYADVLHQTWSICRRLEWGFQRGHTDGTAIEGRYDGAAFRVEADAVRVGGVDVRFKREIRAGRTFLHDFTRQ